MRSGDCPWTSPSSGLNWIENGGWQYHLLLTALAGPQSNFTLLSKAKPTCFAPEKAR